MDPYQVLGISRNASDDEIKKAYRNLSRKYHPDANINNPNKAQAEEKFKQVQQAYDMIMKSKTAGTNGADYSDFFGFGSRYSGSSQTSSDPNENYLRAAAQYIQNGYYREAMQSLGNVPFSARGGRWYYFSAAAYAGMGDNETAMSQINRAVELEPSNMEYRRLKQQLEYGDTWYTTRSAEYGRPYGEGAGGWCASMILLNLLCNCCLPF